MIRSFIAIKIPEGIVKPIVGLQRELQKIAPAVRWVQAENLHVTLLFLGDLSLKDLGYLYGKLEGRLKNSKPFFISFNGLGKFPPKGPTRVIWLGIDQGLVELQQLFASGLKGLLENKIASKETFSPHLTLGRVKDFNGAKDMLSLFEKHKRFVTQKFIVDTVSFFKSDLRPSGPIYTELKTVKLGT